MILLRREPLGPHLPGASRDRAIIAAEAKTMKEYHAWTLRQLAWTIPVGDAMPRYELRPVTEATR